MKEGKQECPKPKPGPKPNLKNKDFVKWQKSEACKTDDNLVASDWHERLQRTPLFTPVYDNAPTNMVYLMSGEYGRMWQKERDDWYSKVFVLSPKEQDMNNRKKKIRKQAREAKKAAEASIQERKERRAKEAEAKAKAEQERAEKIKAKLAKCAAMKKPKKHEPKPKKSPSEQPSTPPGQEPKNEGCPKGWTPVELTIQCECSHHKREDPEKKTDRPNDSATQQPPVEAEKPSSPTSPTMCEDYIKQLAAIQRQKETEAQDES